jgi:hypothetical protein
MNWNKNDFIIHGLLLLMLLFIVVGLFTPPVGYLSTDQQIEWMNPNIIELHEYKIPHEWNKDIKINIQGHWLPTFNKSNGFKRLTIIVDNNDSELLVQIFLNKRTQTLNTTRFANYENGILILTKPIKEPVTDQVFSKFFVIKTKNGIGLLPSPYVEWFNASIDNHTDYSGLLLYQR